MFFEVIRAFNLVQASVTDLTRKLIFFVDLQHIDKKSKLDSTEGNIKKRNSIHLRKQKVYTFQKILCSFKKSCTGITLGGKKDKKIIIETDERLALAFA